MNRTQNENSAGEPVEIASVESALTREGEVFTPKRHDTPSNKVDSKPGFQESRVDINSESRQAQVFTPEVENKQDQLPESITTQNEIASASQYHGIKLEALPIKGLKNFIVGLGVIFAGLIGWELFELLNSAFAAHWTFGATLVAGIGYVAFQGIRSLFNFSRDKQSYHALQGLRYQSDKIADGSSVGSGPELISQLVDFYQDKPQMQQLQMCLDGLPDYANDQEMLEHLEQNFFTKLDEEAKRRIADYSLQTSLTVAASPWASLDMLLSLWRSMKMVDDVAQVYGMRPSIKNRSILIKQVLHQMTFVGASELLIEHALDDFGLNSLAATISARIGQGVGAGVYSMKIGIAAMKVARPFAFTDKNKPKLKQLVAELTRSLKRQFTKDQRP